MFWDFSKFSTLDTLITIFCYLNGLSHVQGFTVKLDTCWFLNS